MKIIKKVSVKQILTENSKQELLQKFKQQVLQFTKEVEQLRFEIKKIEKIKKNRSVDYLSQLEKEISNRLEKCKMLEFQLTQLELLPIGTELKESEVDAMIDIKEGDHWDELTKERTIIIKDGVVVEIR